MPPIGFRQAADGFAVSRAADLLGGESYVVRPLAAKLGLRDFTLADHRRRVAISQLAGMLRSFATFSIASRSSVASTVPSHMALWAWRYTSQDDSGGACGLVAMGGLPTRSDETFVDSAGFFGIEFLGR